MNTKHTPGPWEYRPDTEDDSVVAVLDDDSSTWPVAMVYPAVYGDTEMEEEVRANGLLIAAAPELLEACEKALAAMDELLDRRQGLLTDKEIAALGACRAATKKAKGE